MPFIKNIVAFSKKAPAVQYNVLYMMGNNTNGRLGVGDTTWRSSPVQVGEDFLHVSIGAIHSLGIKTDGTLWAWGSNFFGGLGTGDTTARSSPVQIGTGNTWSYASAGTNHSVALKEDGTLWTWGQNNVGQLGLNDTTNRSSPVQVGTDTNWFNPRACGTSTYALKNGSYDAGELWAWGWNSFGQLGTNNTTNRSSPVQVGADTTWILIGGGTNYVSAMKVVNPSDPPGSWGGREIYVWGNNGNGQLGLNDTTNRSSPVQIGVDQDWAVVASANNHTLALKTDGSLWAWGDNFFGSFGNGNTTSTSSPVQVTGASFDWVWAGGNGHSFGAKNGSLYVWGYGNGGALGLGSTTNISSPVQLGTFANIVISQDTTVFPGPHYVGTDMGGFILAED